MESTTSPRLRARWPLGALVLGALVAPGLAVAAPAGGGATAGSTPIEFTMYDRCTAEFVDVAGTIHSVSKLSVDGSGRSDVTFHQNFSHVIGLGESSGAEYTITGSATQRVSVDAAEVSRLVVHENFVARGSKPDQRFGMLVHMTTSAGGEVTVTLDRSVDDCRG